MKQVKIAFLFFFILTFFFCQKQNNIKEDTPKENSEIKAFYKSIKYKEFNNIQKLKYSKRIFNNKKLNNSDEFLVLNNISYLFGKLNKMDSAIIFSKKMLSLSNVITDKKLNGKIYFKVANYFYDSNQLDSAFYFYKKSKELYLKVNDSIQVGKSLLNIAIIESNFGSYSLSDSSAVESIRYINEKRSKTIASAYNCLAINSKRRFLYDDAITYYNKALNITENKKSKIRYQNNIAILHKDLKDYHKSIFIFQSLLNDKTINKKSKVRVLDNLAYTKWLQNQNIDVLEDLLLANSDKIKIKDNYGLIASYSHLSDYYYLKNKKQSLFYALKSYEISKRQKSVTGQLEAIGKIVKIATPQESIKYYKENIRLRDSLKETNTKRQYKFAKIKYDYEEEEKQKLRFKTLATENKLIAEQENNQKKNILLFAIICTSGLLFLLYRRKQQHKKRVLQETYITETRIAKKLHDELGNDVYNVLNKVQNPKFKTAEIVNDLDKIYLQTRAISHENDSIETGETFEKYFKSLVSSYNSDKCKIILKDLNLLQLNTISKEKQIIIYRIFNELFVNMKKHSLASLVVISCKKEDKYLEFIYADNGVGFKEHKVVLKNGLTNMETRIKSINGTINFESKLDRGCKIIIRLKR